MNTIYHVAKNGTKTGNGTTENPFLTINQAAQVAVAGDTIFVHEGVYREWVSPVNAGLNHHRRITYQAFPGDKVTIKGSEEIKSWEHIQDGIWKVTLPHSFFGDFNPYKEEVFGDWLQKEDPRRHLGDVYLNGMSFFEAETYEELENAEVRTERPDYWTQETYTYVNPEQTKYMWYAEVSAETTTIFATFYEADPNKESVEINVRKACFSPLKVGIDYITVRGFEICQAASPWTPPTSDQIGMVGPNWSKGWIIEDNILHDAKCSAISIGKEGSTGHNHHSFRADKTGHQYQLEAVFLAHRIGWKKETVGSHVIKNNTIYDCGQNGIVGHLGCVFSTIENNHIYNIASKREFYGHEIGGIKLHAPIDVVIKNNRIHDCSLGIWLDWQTQGTRVHGNVFYRNNRDLFIEVSHGPYVVDHNIFASPVELDNFAQGGAYLHNLFCGPFEIQNVLNRSTPYHFPHSTDVAGFSFVHSGDDRFMNNMFMQTNSKRTVGTAGYDDFTTTFEEYLEVMSKDRTGLWEGQQAIYLDNNAYFNGATAAKHEATSHTWKDFNPNVTLEEEDGRLYLSFELPEDYVAKGDIIETKTLGTARIVAAPFDAPDGSDLIFDTDLNGNKRLEKADIGPFEQLKGGTNRFKIW
uniref:right-handed parallel beta-helix repeat-containing protein n=1 Tax=Jeotgalibaca porci TaxID=1868793 RepID=UPI0035A11683